jgi:F0F1-type ATP synthase gamma subunit
MEDLERVQARLSNIESVRPILSALRTVSLGRWQTAQHQQRAARQYRQQLQTILFWLVAELRLSVQSARRQAITRETQALAVGAGLLEHFST